MKLFFLKLFTWWNGQTFGTQLWTWRFGELVGNGPEVACRPNAHHGLAVEAQLQRVGDRHDLHDARLGELLHPLANRGLAEPYGLRDLGVWPAAVFLQLLDDALRDGVEGRRLNWCGASRMFHTDDSVGERRIVQLNSKFSG